VGSCRAIEHAVAFVEGAGGRTSGGDRGDVPSVIERRIHAGFGLLSSCMSPSAPGSPRRPTDTCGCVAPTPHGVIIVRTVEAAVIIEAIGEQYRSHEAWPMINREHAHVASHRLASLTITHPDRQTHASIDRPGDVGAPPRTDGSIGCVGSTLAWQVSRQSSHGTPASHASRIRALLDIMIDDREW
jgi:hypothetical protein